MLGARMCVVVGGDCLQGNEATVVVAQREDCYSDNLFEEVGKLGRFSSKAQTAMDQQTHVNAILPARSDQSSIALLLNCDD